VLSGVTANLEQVGRHLTPPPRQGQHTAEVLADLGVDEASLQTLIAQGVVRTDSV
jgi:crotonobetainyl-CoA:carnitine CoA-transferase CaiB-like acyl-CoA transferase